MSSDSGWEAVDSGLTGFLEDLINVKRDSVLDPSPRVIRQSAFHDFSQYLFFTDPVTGDLTFAVEEERKRLEREVESDGHPPGTGGMGDGVLLPGRWPGLEPVSLESFTESFEPMFERVLVEDAPAIVSYALKPEDYDTTDEGDRAYVLYLIKHGFAPLGARLFALRTELGKPPGFDAAAHSVAEGHLKDWISRNIRERPDGTQVLEVPAVDGFDELWRLGEGGILAELRATFAAPGAGSGDSVDRPLFYSFAPFRKGTVNFGIQLVYRQRWIPLGIQDGEIIRTVPLGPGQTEKVAVKAVRRTKATRSSELATSIENATESSVATKDSSELVEEASESLKWHVEASASGSFGFGSAELSAGVAGEAASSSKAAKSLANDVMEKTASKMRQDTKIVVSTEVEQTTEMGTTSEITNPNDEIAVTYVYSRIQRQYEIHTYLSEVNACVFVAEPLPPPEELTGEWIRRHDWILARALLDESFRADLDTIRRHEPAPPNDNREGVDENIERLMESFSGPPGETATPIPGIPDYRNLPGRLPDIFATPQQAYEREVERRRARDADLSAYRRAEQRLSRHICENILHYMRAIWSAQDPDARLLRFRQLNAQVGWEYRYTPSGSDGTWTPVPGASAPLADVINPAGPIGFAGNYAIYYLKEDGRFPQLERAVGHVRLPFLKHYVTARYLGTPADAFRVAARLLPARDGPGSVLLTWRQAAGQFEISELARRPGAPDRFEVIVAERPGFSGDTVTTRGIEVTIQPGGLDDGAQFRIDIHAIPQLEDPELRQTRETETPIDPTLEADFYTTEVLARFAEYYPDADRALTADGATTWEETSEPTREVLRQRLAEFLLRSRHTRALVLDTNNTKVSLQVGEGSALEAFKAAHRLIDAVSAEADLSRKRLENQRLQRRLEEDQLGDPDVERVTVISSDRLAGFPAIDPTSDDG